MLRIWTFIAAEQDVKTTAAVGHSRLAPAGAHPCQGILQITIKTIGSMPISEHGIVSKRCCAGTSFYSTLAADSGQHILATICKFRFLDQCSRITVSLARILKTIHGLGDDFSNSAATFTACSSLLATM